MNPNKDSDNNINISSNFYEMKAKFMESFLYSTAKIVIKKKELNDIVQQLISNGYDNELAKELLKRVIDLKFEIERTFISSYLACYMMNLSLWKNRNVSIAGIFKMENDNDDKIDDLLHGFRFKIINELTGLIYNSDLATVFKNAGIIDEQNDHFYLDKLGFYDCLSAENNPDLIALSIYGDYHYIPLSDIKVLLAEKGLDEDCYHIVWGKYEYEPHHPNNPKDKGLFLDFQAINRKDYKAYYNQIQINS